MNSRPCGKVARVYGILPISSPDKYDRFGSTHKNRNCQETAELSDDAEEIGLEMGKLKQCRGSHANSVQC